MLLFVSDQAVLLECSLGASLGFSGMFCRVLWGQRVSALGCSLGPKRLGGPRMVCFFPCRHRLRHLTALRHSALLHTQGCPGCPYSRVSGRDSGSDSGHSALLAQRQPTGLSLSYGWLVLQVLKGARAVCLPLCEPGPWLQTTLSSQTTAPLMLGAP